MWFQVIKTIYYPNHLANFFCFIQFTIVGVNLKSHFLEKIGFNKLNFIQNSFTF